MLSIVIEIVLGGHFRNVSGGKTKSENFLSVKILVNSILGLGKRIKVEIGIKQSITRGRLINVL
jgi:hypothetical protein